MMGFQPFSNARDASADPAAVDRLPNRLENKGLIWCVGMDDHKPTHDQDQASNS
jgi:hypothetical protein